MRANQDYYNYNNWVGTKNLVFGSVFLYKYAGFFNMLGAWHPPNILPTWHYGPCSGFLHYKSSLICELQRALYGIKCVLRIFLTNKHGVTY